MQTLKDLLSQRATLDQQIEEATESNRQEGIAKVTEVMAAYGLTVTDLGGSRSQKTSSKSGKKVTAKYRNPETGESWSGRGLKPKWLQAALGKGKKIEDFAV